jgi:hypothetical protein
MKSEKEVQVEDHDVLVPFVCLAKMSQRVTVIDFLLSRCDRETATSQWILGVKFWRYYLCRTMYAAPSQAASGYRTYLGWTNCVNSSSTPLTDTDPRWCSTPLCTLKKLSVSVDLL